MTALHIAIACILALAAFEIHRANRRLPLFGPRGGERHQQGSGYVRGEGRRFRTIHGGSSK